MSLVVEMFMVRAKKQSAVIMERETIVSGDGCVVSSFVELCMIWRMNITSVRGCVGCCMIMLLIVV